MKHLLFFFMLSGGTALAQTDFLKKMQTSEYDAIHAISTCTDGGYIMSASNSLTVSVIKTDSAGSIQWAKQLLPLDTLTYFAGTPLAVGECVTGGYYYFANLTDPNYLSSYVLTKITTSGDVQWATEIIINDDNINYRANILQHANGDFLITPSIYQTNRLVLLDSNGTIKWGIRFTNGAVKNYGYTAVACYDGGFISCGMADGDMFLVKTDSLGDVDWTKRYQDSTIDTRINVAIPTLDSNYLLAGYRGSNTLTGGCIIKINPAGDILWHKVYNLGSFDYAVELPNGDVVLGGPYFITRISADGTIIYNKLFGNGSETYVVTNLNLNSNNELLVSGAYYNVNSQRGFYAKFENDPAKNCAAFSSPATEVDHPSNFIITTNNIVSSWFFTAAFLMQTRAVSVSSTDICVTGIESEEFVSAKISPNPATGIVSIETLINKGFYQLRDITGKTLLQGTVSAEKFTLDISTLSSGVYFIAVSDAEKQVNGKVVKD